MKRTAVVPMGWEVGEKGRCQSKGTHFGYKRNKFCESNVQHDASNVLEIIYLKAHHILEGC